VEIMTMPPIDAVRKTSDLGQFVYLTRSVIL